MIEKCAKVWLGGRKGVTAPIHVSQYDTGWRFLLSVYDGDAVYTGGDGTAVYLEGKKADQTVFAVPGTFTVGMAVVECTAAMTAAVGVIDCELRISEDGETIGTANFEIIVEAAPLKGYVASGDDFSAMQQVLDGANEAKNAAAASANAAAVSAATAQVQAGMAYKIAATADAMTDHDIGYVYTGSEDGYTNGGWYYWDGSAWALGGMSVDPTLLVSGAAADAKVTGDEIGDLKSAINDIATMSAEKTGDSVSGWESGHNILSNGGFGTSTTFSATPEFIPLPDYVDKVTYMAGAYSSFVATYSAPDVSGFIERISVSAGNSVDINTATAKYIRISISSLDTTDASTIIWRWRYPLTQLPFNSRASDAVTLANGTDIDTITTPGNYKVLSAASAATMTGTPPITTTSYRLFVLQTIYGRLMQFAFLNTGASTEKLTVRFYNGTTWGDWLPFASKNDVDNAAKNSFSLLHSNATVIANNTNLNTLTTAGNYKATSAATVATLVNLPAQVQAAFALKVVQLSQSQRLMQVLYEQTIATPVYRRYYNGSTWSEWLKEAKEEQLIDLTNKIVTSDDYLTYFPNGLLSDAKPNTIWGIYDSSLFADAPIGDDWIGTEGRDGGSMRGTLFTFSQANRHDKVQTGLTQIFVGYRGPSFKPTMSYRIAVVSNGVYSWSNWSKFEENGYLHASNMIVYGGNMSATFDDMNDMPRNTICQLDLNLNGSDAAHTLANHPAPGVSCVAMCYAFSYTASHGKVQTVFTIDGRLYWRYGYTQAQDDYRWTQWRLLNANVPPIPDAPDTDGTYTLQCVVDDGVKTYSWVSA